MPILLQDDEYDEGGCRRTGVAGRARLRNAETQMPNDKRMFNVKIAKALRFSGKAQLEASSNPSFESFRFWI